MRSNDARRERFCRLFVGLLFVTLSSGFAAARSSSNEPGAAGATVAHRSPSADAIEAYRTRPMAFELNQGQTDPQVKFLVRAPGYTAFLTSMGNALALQGPGGSATVVRMQIIGANPSARIVGVEPLAGKVNYFRGGNPEQQVTNVPTYARVRYVDLYPGVEMVYYGRERQVEYDFVVAPGADPNVITLAFEGTDKLEVNDQGDLVLHTAAGELRQHRPFIYQEVAGARQSVSGGYVLSGKREVGFRVGSYDARHPLVIDPVLVYSTYLGGSGHPWSVDKDGGTDIAVDASGNVYVTGATNSIEFGRSWHTDVFVAKFNPTGTRLLYMTYLDGSGWDDRGHAIAVDPVCIERVDTVCNAYVAGWSDRQGILVAKLGPTGIPLYQVSFGANAPRLSMDAGYGIAVGTNGNAYVTGWTRTPYASEFPTTAGAFQRSYGGGDADAFVVRLNGSGGFVYSTFLGGSGLDQGAEIEVDAAGNAYVTGSTESEAPGGFPTTPGSFQPVSGGDRDVFIAKLNPTGSGLVYSTHLGGSGKEAGNDLALDRSGNAYVTGWTVGYLGTENDFPTRNAFKSQASGGVDSFYAKLDANGSALVYSSYLSGPGSGVGRIGDAGGAIAVDGAGNAYVTGETISAPALYPGSPGFPVVNAFQPRPAGGFDAFVTKVGPTGSRLVYSSYLGGGYSDSGYGIAVARGNVYVTGQTESDNFPTKGAFQPRRGSGSCNNACPDAFVTKVR